MLAPAQVKQCDCPMRTPEQELERLLEDHARRRGALIPVLQKAQDIYGYLPVDALRRVARRLGLPLSQVYGVATFYSQFHLTPRGRHIVRVCLGTACHVRGGARILRAIEDSLDVTDGQTSDDLEFTLESVACIGACGLAPVLMVDEDTHGRLTPDSVRKIIAVYREKGDPE